MTGHSYQDYLSRNPKDVMKIEIDYIQDRDQYFWNIVDGPDGIDHGEGIALSLGEAFEQIVKWRTTNALHYV